jgi:hypothetical protein
MGSRHWHPERLFIAEGREFLTMPVTQHFELQVEIIEKFLARRVTTESRSDVVHVRTR